jgi:hypothetical protein
VHGFLAHSSRVVNELYIHGACWRNKLFSLESLRQCNKIVALVNIKKSVSVASRRLAENLQSFSFGSAEVKRDWQLDPAICPRQHPASFIKPCIWTDPSPLERTHTAAINFAALQP